MKGSLVRPLAGLLGGILALAASAKILAELPHYNCLLVVHESELDLTTLGVEPRLDQRGARLTRTVLVPEISLGLAQ